MTTRTMGSFWILFAVVHLTRGHLNDTTKQVMTTTAITATTTFNKTSSSSPAPTVTRSFSNSTLGPDTSTTFFEPLIEHYIFNQTFEIIQPYWWNPWNQQIRLNLARNSQILSIIEYQNRFARWDLGAMSPNYSEQIVEINSRLIVPLDHFWYVMVQEIAPLVTLVLFTVCMIIEPLCSGSNLFKNCCLSKFIRRSAVFRIGPESAAEKNASFDFFYRRISTVMQSENTAGKVKNIKNETNSTDRLFAGGRKSAKSLASWNSFESLPSRRKKPKVNMFTFDDSTLFAEKTVKSDPLRVKWS